MQEETTEELQMFLHIAKKAKLDPFVRFWLHGAFLIFKGEKISKSRGGCYILSEIEEKGFSPLDLRYFFLSAHYRRPLNFSLESLKNSRNSMQRLKEIISKIKDSKEKKNAKNIGLAYNQFLEIINDDLNTPRAVSYLWDILREGRLNNAEKYELALKFDEVFGLNLGKEEKIKISEEVKKLVNEREKARKNKNWKEADKIREKINKLGYFLEDTEKGVVIKRK